MLSRIKKSDAPGITLLAKPRIQRSGRSSALPYPPLRLKAYSGQHAVLLLSMYNLCGQGVQFVRFECSTNAVALFNSERFGCLMWAGYSINGFFTVPFVPRFKKSEPTSLEYTNGALLYIPQGDVRVRKAASQFARWVSLVSPPTNFILE